MTKSVKVLQEEAKRKGKPTTACGWCKKKFRVNDIVIRNWEPRKAPGLHAACADWIARLIIEQVHAEAELIDAQKEAKGALEEVYPDGEDDDSAPEE